MPSLTHSIVDFRGLNLPTSEPLVPKVIPVAEKIIEKYPPGEVGAPYNIDEIIERVSRQFKANEDVDSKDLKKVALSILTHYQDKKFFDSTLDEISKHRKKRHFSALFIAYVIGFDASNQNCLRLAQFLEKNKDHLPKRWLRRLEKINLLECKAVVKKIAKLLLNNKNNGAQTFAEIGLSGPLATGNLVQESMIALGKLVREKALNQNTAYMYMDDFISTITEDNKIKDIARVAGMIGLLSPFSDSQPPAHLKGKIKKLFINTFSDPRIDSSKWPEIKEVHGGAILRNDCILVVKKWLIFETIETFLKIIEKHAIKHQFAPRKELWHSYFKQEFVVDAHIVLGRRAERTAYQLLNNADEDLKDSFNFGKLNGARSDQSVLLMKLSGRNGSLVVAEWSHSGRFRAWSEDSESKPDFHKEEYYASNLRRNSDWDAVHIGSWIDKVERYIRAKTDIRLSRKFQ